MSEVSVMEFALKYEEHAPGWWVVYASLPGHGWTYVGTMKPAEAPATGFVGTVAFHRTEKVNGPTLRGCAAELADAVATKHINK